MRPSRRLGCILAVSLAAASLATNAFADADAGATGDGGPPTMTPGAILAHYCGDIDMRCMMAPIEFDYTHRLLNGVPNVDTGWKGVDSGSLQFQVRFQFLMPTDTQVSMAGQFRVDWPPALSITAPGERFSGFLKIDYGLVVKTTARIHATLGGLYTFDWEGNIPYIPQVDFHLLGMKQFDAWVYPPESAQVSAFTPQLRLFSFNALSLLDIPPQVGELGIALDIRGEMRATYHTEKIVVEPAMLPIVADNGDTLHDFMGGGFVEFDVHPEGKMSYDGVLHFIPELYLKLLNGAISTYFPLYDFPINITQLLNLDLHGSVVFDKVRVHVPLPDIIPFEQPAVIDFGEVLIGSGDKYTLHIVNIGEAKARAFGEIDSSISSAFKMLSPATTANPGETGEMQLRFAPNRPGTFEGKLVVKSNDPDLPEQVITLKGKAVMPSPSDTYDPGGDGTRPVDRRSVDSADEDGCGCGIIGDRPGILGAWWLVALSIAALPVRRRVVGFGRTLVSKVIQ